jgi:NAD(P)-dependent dehydrogenase (short-subunit alcohol dehydrogenase family)
MTSFQDKTAVISGGAEGIGLAIGRALGKRGMNIVIADINAEQLAKAEAELDAAGIPVLATPLDVADATQWQQTADQAIERFGKVHMVVNNAGVGGLGGTIAETNARTWQWVLDVNLMGVVYGTQVMVPLISAHGEGGWVVNVASLAGFGPLPLATPYTATKAAVVAMTENWALELAPEGIHACVLCPGFTQTRINESERNMPGRYATGDDQGSAAVNGMEDLLKKVVEEGMPSDVVGERVVEALQAGEFYIFTHPSYGDMLTGRFRTVEAALHSAERSPVLEPYRDLPPPSFD